MLQRKPRPRQQVRFSLPKVHTHHSDYDVSCGFSRRMHRLSMKTPVSAEWKKGSNVRGAAKAEAAANKADEAARRRREKAELLKGKITNE